MILAVDGSAACTRARAALTSCSVRIHVHVPVEEQVDLRRAAAGDGLHVVEARHRVDGFLDGPRHGDQHLIDGHDAVLHAEHNAREIGFRENRHGNAERQVDAR